MSKSIVVGTTLAVLGLGGMAFGAWQMQEAQEARQPQYAEITGVEPLTRSVETPREVCENVTVQRQAPTRDPHRVVGSAAGVIVGGLLGNQIGGGSGKKIATVAGAVGGGLAGREVQERIESGQTVTTTEQRCHTVTDTHQETTGYEVSWRHDGEVHTSRLDSRPEGERVRLVDGKPQWQASTSPAEG
ncbi:glycine zipper 2TM domain-containing protein [Halomonas elongata]|uniref:glycine zipper 2TM domain-containing protein n=1 Tax=Halomonas elongata TaxID=2746 RepID=UPI00186BA55F|nr:glycine zipper 2TM domain-containing protein [Halomonas elongata]MBW5801572.1 glycine zipper 2TM domain-containing protein [Halomonas elongata]